MKQETKEKIGLWYTTYSSTFDKIDNIVKGLDFKNICPLPENILKAFYSCKYKDLRVLMLQQDPYHSSFIHEGKSILHATGIAFANPIEAKVLSPSLQKIEQQVLEQGYIFLDKTLENWCEQGVLMLNASLTTERNTPKMHINIWKTFMQELLKEVTLNNPGLIVALIGSYAQSFKDNLKGSNILMCEHPAAACYADRNWNSGNLFNAINSILMKNNGEKISW
jgi:uracil-DNA glycosylase